MESSIVRIEAYIRPASLVSVQEALNDLDIFSFTIVDARGTGEQRVPGHTFRGSTYGSNTLPRIKLEIVISRSRLDETLAAIQDSAFTGEMGDGMVLVIPVEEVLRIRTGERGINALM